MSDQEQERHETDESDEPDVEAHRHAMRDSAEERHYGDTADKQGDTADERHRHGRQDAQ